MIAVSRYEMVLLVLKKMLPYLYKKANEAESAIDDYEGRITGDELVAVFRREVDAGRRERHAHKVEINVPFLHNEGSELMELIRNQRLRDALGRFRAKVTPGDYADIRELHFVQEMRLRDLMAKYPQYSKETIRRILGRDRGRVLVKGFGIVYSPDDRNTGG